MGPVQDSEILEHMELHEILPPGAGQNRTKLRKDIEEYHTVYAIDFDDTFIPRRPDGLDFNKEKKLCVSLEYTIDMDTNEDWAEKKDQEKNDRYHSHLGFINHLSHREKSGWKASQTISNQFHNRSTRLSTYKPVPYETGIARVKEYKHARSHTQ